MEDLSESEKRFFINSQIEFYFSKENYKDDDFLKKNADENGIESIFAFILYIIIVIKSIRLGRPKSNYDFSENKRKNPRY